MIHFDLFLVGSEIAVNTLTDIFVDYFSKLCRTFKINVEKQQGGEKNNELIYVRTISFHNSVHIDGNTGQG